MKQSDQINEIATALAKVQGEYKKVAKNKTAKVRMKTGGEYSYKFADLADVLEMALPILSKYEIALLQPTQRIDGKLYIVSVIVHSSGQWFSSDGILITQESDKQGLGSEVSYSRRYDGCSLIGIMPDEDEDGKISTEKARETPNVPAKTYPPKVDQRPATPNNSSRPNENKQTVLKGVVNPLINAIPQKPDYTLTMGGFKEVPENGLKEAKKDNSVTVGGQTGEINLGITLDDVPLFDEPLRQRDDFPSDAPEDAVTFVPLTPSRYEEIQTTLKGMLARKITGVPERKFRTYLEWRHGGKKSFDVPSWKWEETVKNLSDAYEAGDQAVKDLLLPAKV